MSPRERRCTSGYRPSPHPSSSRPARTRTLLRRSPHPKTSSRPLSRLPGPTLPPPATLNRRPRLWQEDTVIGLRQAQQHLPDITLAALGWARANDPDFPTSVGKRGAELLYRVGDIKKWACNRAPRRPGTRPGLTASGPGVREPALSGPADTIPSSWRTPGTAQKRNTAP
ncbi:MULTISPECIES: hypothetical protein [Streptomyces]|uniref:hypothetical protein n=1 Tax=Streptomyces TaxID=1883 RepID=UPI001C0E95A6|nr:hypothetical protein [Streptomyces kasugaensis]